MTIYVGRNNEEMIADFDSVFKIVRRTIKGKVTTELGTVSALRKPGLHTPNKKSARVF